ncbi:MAG: S8 family serine peptidase [Erysipelotrichaceae bacterium]|nr:S8 family serine peptidase [Erysipelotrichaceae bacterium]
MAKKSHIFRNIIFILLILIIGIGLGVGVFLFKDKLSSNQYDEDNVVEIYYQGIDEEHVASIDDYISYADNEVLVVTNDGVSYSKIEKLASSYNASIVGYIEQTGDYQLELNDAYTVDALEDLIKQLENEDIIDSASINYITEVTEDTINYGNEWSEELESLDNSGKGWNLKLANVLSAWDTLDRQNQDTINPVRIGLIDSGFDTTQEDLGFAEVFYNDNIDSKNYSHGTHVAGIMAAKSNNDEGICGVYPYGDGNLYGVSTTGIKNNSENNVSTMAYKIAFAELIFRNVKVINVSQGYNWYLHKAFSTYLGDTRIYTDYQDLLDFWQTYDFSGYEEEARCLGDFLNRTLEKGFDFVIVSTAGNDSDTSIGHLESRYASSLNLITEDDYPDVYNRIIVVGSIDSTAETAYYSNGGNRVDIYAPGGEESSKQSDKKMIYSTLPDDDYGYLVGTSQAAPLVSGVAGMVWSVYNELTGEEVKETIISSANTYNDVLVVDASDALSSVLMTSKFTELSTADYGGILCFVVNSENEDERISEATVTAINKDTNEIETTTTDTFGHFELIITEGEYILTVSADGYEDYTIDTVEVKAAGVNYLDDWIKLSPKIEISKIAFSSDYNNGYQYASVNAYDSDNQVVWTYTTSQYTATELDRVSDIGQKDNVYYIVEDRQVIALDVSSGNVLWKSEQKVGAGNGFAFGDDAIYLCGYYGPDFIAISYSGDTLYEIGTFDDNYSWPYKIEVKNDKAYVYMEGNSIDYNDIPIIFCVDLITWEYQKVTSTT